MPPHEDEPLWPSADTDETEPASGGDPASAEEREPGSDDRDAQPAQVSLDDQPTMWVKAPARPPREPSPQEMTQQLPLVPPWARQPSPDQASGAAPEQTTLFAPVPQPGQADPDRLRDQPTLFTPVPQPGRPAPGMPTGARPIPPAGSAHAQPMRIEPSGEVRPADTAAAGSSRAVETPETSTGETPVPPPAGAEPVTAEPRRKKRGIVYGGVALVLVIVVGVALALPYVSNRLGLPWAPNLPKGDTPQPPTVNLALHAPSPTAPAPTDSGVGTALAGPSANGTLGTLTGIVIDPATGDVLWNRDSGQLLTPASTTKILTTSAALLQLDHGLQLLTKVVQGSSPDTAIIVAGGDLTLSSLPDGNESVYQGAAHLDDLVSQVKQAGGGTIKKVQIDLSAYTGGGTAPGWAPEDAPSTYATQIVPAMLDGGMSDPANDHSMRSGNPAGDLLQSFAQRLGASVATTTTAKAPQGAKVLGEVKSAPLTELISQLLEHSDNELAEAVARQTAIATGQPPSFAGGAQATLSVLSQNGFDVSGVSLNDGSGLSTLNKVPARLLAQLISVAAAPEGKDPRTAKLRPLLEGLPVAGGSGTLADRYGDASSSAGKGWIRAKTGTLSGVNTLAGVVLDKDGRVLVFALMSNNNGDINATRAALDAVAAKLRGCGCQ
ncbi:MAG TPA: D-alanyl-D-alanine carboxypeptidase/D-alanyl-D-alanine-endopeptidase [Amycolatopsis sp.]|nr:D-alanyl-D-alanine carboxypeptidase/D-alanyl-D-alanine-endopeptidase [Amycolatopsis sp.]